MKLYERIIKKPQNKISEIEKQWKLKASLIKLLFSSLLCPVASKKSEKYGGVGGGG